MAGYNRTRYVEALLERTEGQPPSFTVHLHLEYWTLNNGSKFLYNNQIASLLDDIRAHRIPVDFLDLFEAAKVPFYDGCMIVELLDYRPQRNKEFTLEKPERTRAVLHPNSETLWADICSLNQRYGGKWSDKDALEIEARILLATSPPLCLDPDPHLTRIANHVLRVSTPTVPVSLKRKAAALDPEEDETDKARRTKIMQFMAPRSNRTHPPNYRILDIIQNSKQVATGKSATPLPGNQFMSGSQQGSPAKPSTPAQNFAQAQSPVELDDKSNVKVKKAETPQMQFAATAFTKTNGPPQTHQFISQNPNNPSPSPSAQSPMQPQVYPSLQAATDTAKRAPTPAQRQLYSQSPRPPSSQAPAPPKPSQHQNPIQTQTQTPTFQPQVPNQHFLNAPPQGVRNSTPKMAPSNIPQAAPQQMQTPQNLAQAQLMYAHQLQQQQGQHMQQQQANAMLQQRLIANQKAGRSTPQATPSQATPSPARSSPMVTNKTLTARSPMPPNSQPAAQQQNQHPPQHPQHAFTPQYNPAALRPMIHQNPAGHPQAISHHVANSGTNTQPTAPPATAEGQPQMHAYPGMYGYGGLGYAPIPPGRMGYWQVGMGRGVPGMMNGQPMPGMTPNGQQVPVGGGKTAPAGIPGR